MIERETEFKTNPCRKRMNVMALVDKVNNETIKSVVAIYEECCTVLRDPDDLMSGRIPVRKYTEMRYSYIGNGKWFRDICSGYEECTDTNRTTNDAIDEAGFLHDMFIHIFRLNSGDNCIDILIDEKSSPEAHENFNNSDDNSYKKIIEKVIKEEMKFSSQKTKED